MKRMAAPLNQYGSLWLDPCGARGSSAVDGGLLSLNHGVSEAAPVNLLRSFYQTCLALPSLVLFLHM